MKSRQYIQDCLKEHLFQTRKCNIPKVTLAELLLHILKQAYLNQVYSSSSKQKKTSLFRSHLTVI